MATVIIPSAKEEVLLTFQYHEQSGLDWCDMWENHVLGWRVDDEDPTVEAEPVIVGAMPVPMDPTDPVLSALWAVVPDYQHRGGDLCPRYVARHQCRLAVHLDRDQSRATRRLRGNFCTPPLIEGWRTWSGANPGSVYAG
jgi:hypothetical protein